MAASGLLHYLVVLFPYLEIALGMVADGTYFRGLGAHHNMPAVPTFPYGNGALFKHLLGFDVVEQGTVPLPCGI